MEKILNYVTKKDPRTESQFLTGPRFDSPSILENRENGLTAHMIIDDTIAKVNQRGDRK
jgi:hypothetical protein